LKPLREILGPDAPERFARKLFEMAQAGHTGARLHLFESFFPVSQHSLMDLGIPPVETPDDGLQAIRQVRAALLEGRISPQEATRLTWRLPTGFRDGAAEARKVMARIFGDQANRFESK
jgi:hypothetical protein